MRFYWLVFLLVFLVIPPAPAQSILGENEVFQSADRGDTAAVEEYLLTGNNPNIRDLKKIPLLHHAAIAGVPKTVSVLIRNGAQVDIPDPFGNTALIQAAAYGSTAAAEILIEGKAKIDEENRQGETALIKAAKSGHAQVTKLLLAKGATLDLTDFTGRTALDHAKQNRHSDVVRLLSDAAE
ncbi:ankyrin repeat domain-containing protein [Sneathiella sp. HT1-7]|uniref:ankyrin repeat domain-containing protein n=1 Tax=Sneathiella sp. HT1-7 TaxID=2887192 RepID=UPI001D14E48D|nr:ankyrin repeat domain-containing protein [Sneathiella sp. HT1-7]MCC3303938.1 ankyrin repeat domain-containing protein [Sneathiella sp. HT1-7]